MSATREITIVHSESSNRPTIFAAGGYCGMTQDGQVSVQLYVDLPSLPLAVKLTVDEIGNVETHTEQGKRGDVSREIQAIIVLPAEIAIQLAEMLRNAGGQILKIKNPDSRGAK